MMTGPSWLWIVFTLVGATAQTFRNATQRSLTGELGTGDTLSIPLENDVVRPALLRWQGASETGLSSHPGVLAESLTNRGDRRHFVRVRRNADGQVVSAGRQASHALSSLAQANGLVDLCAGEIQPTGAVVKVLGWE